MKARLRVLTVVVLLLCVTLAAGAQTVPVDPDALYQQFCEGVVTVEDILLLQEQGDVAADFWKVYEFHDDPVVKAAISKWIKQKPENASSPVETDAPAEVTTEQPESDADLAEALPPETTEQPEQTTLPEEIIVAPGEDQPPLPQETQISEESEQPAETETPPIGEETEQIPVPPPAAQPPQENIAEDQPTADIAPEAEAEDCAWEEALEITFSSPPVLRYEVDLQNGTSISRMPEHSTVDLFVTNRGDKPSVSLSISAEALEKTDEYGGFTVGFEPLVENGFVLQPGESKQIGIFWYRQVTQDALPVVATSQTLLLEICLDQAQ